MEQIDIILEKDRCQSLRTPLTRFVVYHARWNVEVVVNGEEVYPGTVLNISEGGLCLLVARPLVEGQVITVGLPLQNLPVTIPALGEVRWLRKIPWEEHYFIGVQFLWDISLQ